MNEELINRTKVAFASSFAFMLKAWNYHWNVEGINFPQYHDFFGDLYEEVQDNIDKLAEHIRAIDAYAPGTFERLKQLSSIPDDNAIPPALIMCQKLAEANDKVLEDLTFAYEEAESQKAYGLSNYLQDRIEAHRKHRWMLNSIQKG